MMKTIKVESGFYKVMTNDEVIARIVKTRYTWACTTNYTTFWFNTKKEAVEYAIKEYSERA